MLSTYWTNAQLQNCFIFVKQKRHMLRHKMEMLFFVESLELHT